MKRSDAQLAQDALVHFDALHAHLSRADLSDSTIIDAVCMRLSSAIETLSHLSESTREELFGSDWTAIRSVRNRIAHGYLNIDHAMIEIIVTDELPQLEQAVRRLAATT